MLAAIWVFAVYYLPATLRLFSWLGHTLATGDIAHTAFWEALGFGLLTVSSRLVTAGVAVRDLARRLRDPQRSTALSRRYS